MYCRVLKMMSTDVSDVRSLSIDLRTRQYIPEDSELHSRYRENLKSHMEQDHVGRIGKEKDAGKRTLLSLIQVF
jgi:hypothetical protein